jgi:SAM-dependent methyltransferase
VDRTDSYLVEARARAEDAGLPLELVLADMRAFVRPNTYDVAVNLFTSFGYFEDENENLRVLANLHTSLRPGGALVMELAAKEVLAREFRERDWTELSDGTLVLQERRIARGWTWIESRWIIIKDGERRELPLAHRIYGASDLTTLLNEAGFANVRVYGDLSGSPYDHTAKRLVVVARKPE